MLKKFFLGCFAIVAAIALTGCGSKKVLGMSYSELNGEWDVIEMNGQNLNPSQTDQLLVFNTTDNTISGNAGCNRISGRIEHNPLQRHVVRIMQVASTRMACLDDNKMRLENEFLQNIDKVARFEAVEGATTPTVNLYGLDNSRLFVLRKK